MYWMHSWYGGFNRTFSSECSDTDVDFLQNISGLPSIREGEMSSSNNGPCIIWVYWVPFSKERPSFLRASVLLYFLYHDLHYYCTVYPAHSIPYRTLEVNLHFQFSTKASNLQWYVSAIHVNYVRRSEWWDSFPFTFYSVLSRLFLVLTQSYITYWKRLRKENEKIKRNEVFIYSDGNNKSVDSWCRISKCLKVNILRSLPFLCGVKTICKTARIQDTCERSFSFTLNGKVSKF